MNWTMLLFAFHQIFKSCCKMQIRAMSAGSEDIPQFLHSVFTSPDLGSGATEVCILYNVPHAFVQACI